MGALARLRFACTFRIRAALPRLIGQQACLPPASDFFYLNRNRSDAESSNVQARVGDVAAPRRERSRTLAHAPGHPRLERAMQIEPPTLTLTRPVAVRLRRGATGAIAALVCAALVSACGGSSSTGSASNTNLNTGRVGKSIEQTLLEKRHVHAAVVCPGAVPQETGRTF